MGEVDPAFIQATEHRPELDQIIKAEEIPLIDLSIISSPSTNVDPSGLVKEIGNACKNWGFFQVINHGVPLYKRQKLENVSRNFFGQSIEEKMKVRRDENRVWVIMTLSIPRMLGTGKIYLISLWRLLLLCLLHVNMMTRRLSSGLISGLGIHLK
ncbi:unnamed protein product [Dovyalis caffra]|uniref:Non-haem dioxygenase N-terminal domain-containing protein n=1 Tax=Dovyalis caffra TaxID=77055 RepID=A0AAV1RB92_9ROSI|nr:unnamed protein product [Dovyalis caffra]